MLDRLAGEGEGAGFGALADVGQVRGEQLDGAADGVRLPKGSVCPEDVAVEGDPRRRPL